ncbi:MAG: class I SAM-dependent methyltransferase [Pseudomonadota bacterium]
MSAAVTGRCCGPPGSTATPAVVVDASPEQVAVAARLAIAAVRQAEICEALAGLADATQDVVTMFDLLHYFSREEQSEIIDEIRRVLRPGGRWILHLPNGWALFGARMHYWDYLAAGASTRVSLAQILLASGFRAVACHEERPVVHGLKSAVTLGAMEGAQGRGLRLRARPRDRRGRAGNDLQPVFPCRRGQIEQVSAQHEEALQGEPQLAMFPRPAEE